MLGTRNIWAILVGSRGVLQMTSSKILLAWNSWEMAKDPVTQKLQWTRFPCGQLCKELETDWVPARWEPERSGTCRCAGGGREGQLAATLWHRWTVATSVPLTLFPPKKTSLIWPAPPALGQHQNPYIREREWRDFTVSKGWFDLTPKSKLKNF